MKIHYKIIDEYSTENQKRIVSFLSLLINLLEIYKKMIPVSSFEKNNYNASEVESFITIINNLITGDMSAYINHTGAIIEVSHKTIIGSENDNRDFEKNLYFDYDAKAISTLKSILEKLIDKGYGEVTTDSFEVKEKHRTLNVKIKAGLFEYKEDKKIYFKSKIIEGLEPRETKILICLMQSEDILVTYEKIAIAATLNGDPVTLLSIKKYVSPLHQKLKKVIKKEDKKFHIKVITTVPKSGYKLESKKIQDFFTKK